MAEIDASDAKAFPSDRVRELATQQVVLLGNRSGADLQKYHWEEPFTKVPPVRTPRWVRRDRNLLPHAFPMVVWRPESGIRSTCDVIDDRITRLVTPTTDGGHGVTSVGPTPVMMERLVRVAFRATEPGALLAVVRDHLVRSHTLGRPYQSRSAPRPPRGFRWERLPRDEVRYVHLVWRSDADAGRDLEVTTSPLIPDGLPALAQRPAEHEVVALLSRFLELTRPLLAGAGS